MPMPIIAWFSILFCFLTGLYLLSRKPLRLSTFFLVAAFTLVAVLEYLGISLSSAPEELAVWQEASLVCEVLLALAWYGYGISAFRSLRAGFKAISTYLVLFVLATMLIVAGKFRFEAFFYSPDFAEEKILFLTQVGFYFYLALICVLVFTLMQLERTLAALPQHQRWNVKFEIIGCGLIISVFAIYFSHGLFYRTFDLSLLPIRSFAVIIGALMAAYSRIARGGIPKLTLSRDIAYRSLVLLVVGGYLVLIGLAGEGMRYLDLRGERTFFYGLILLGALFIVVLFLSETFKRKVKVALHKNFFKSKYDYRQQWLEYTQRIAGAESSADLQNAVLVFFCETFAFTGAAIYLFDNERQEFVNTAHFRFLRDWRPFGEEDPLVRRLAQKDWIIDLKDESPELGSSLVEALRRSGAVFVIPMFFEQQLTGFIVLAEQIDRSEHLTYEDYDLMRMLANQSIVAIQGVRLNEQLAKTRELTAIGKVSTFVLHDLKNQVSGLALMLDNAREHIADPEFQEDMLETVDSTVGNMKELIARLKNLKNKPEIIVEPVDLKTLIDDAALTAGEHIVVEGETLEVDANEEEIYKVVLNLLLNAREASGPEEVVRVEISQREGRACVEVVDCGCGMSEEFIRTRLFQPFETTKKNGFGIGLYQCRQIVETYNGQILVESRPGEGTKFTLLLPLVPNL